MLSSIKLKLSTNPEKSYYSSMASMLQGFLMEIIDSDYADKLHIDGIHPYSTYFTAEGSSAYWIVNTLSSEAGNQMANALLDNSLQSIYLKGKNETLKIQEKTIESISYEDLIQHYYFNPCNRTIRLKFLTATSFKQAGKYMIYPTPRLIFQSLMQKYDASSNQSSIFSEDLLEEFEDHAVVTGYRMKSTLYHIERVRIPSFIGELTLRINGSQQLANVAMMLVKFGEFSGVGIKTGMGMGAMEVIDQERNRVSHE